VGAHLVVAEQAVLKLLQVLALPLEIHIRSPLVQVVVADGILATQTDERKTVVILYLTE
jgi:hypothetical protein